MCSIKGCNREKIYARGWCKPHYAKWQRNGDPEKRVRSPAADYVSDVVMTYEGDECLIWPFSGRKGYGYIRVNDKLLGVHRLACEKANGHAPTPKHEAAHSCGKGHLGCVTKRHLSWKTHIENMGDAIAHGTSSRKRKVN